MAEKPSATWQFGTLDIRGMRIRYGQQGPSDGVPLVLIPGLTSRIEEYTALAEGLAHRFRVLCLDFPGAGESEKPDRAYSVALYVETLLAFLDELGIRRAHLVGGSLGGNVALRTAHIAPDRTLRVVAWGAGGAWRPKRMLAFLARRLGGKTLLWPTLWAQSMFWFSRHTRDRWTLRRKTFADIAATAGPGTHRMYWGLVADQLRNSLFSVARRVAVPVLLLRGADDYALGMANGMAKLRDLIPNATLTVVPNVGHAIATEDPSTLAWLATTFLSGDGDPLGDQA